MTDTVGLIKKLPHHLVNSFHATLEEVADADFLLHVVDVSRPHCERYLELAESVISDIGARRKPARIVLVTTNGSFRRLTVRKIGTL